MKRLLLPLLAALVLPTAVDAFPWDKKDEDIIDEDIIIKTDLDEEYIVKDSTVTITPWSKLDAIKAVQENHPIDVCLKKGFSNESCFKDLFSKKVTSHLKKENALIEAEISTPMNIIRFRPIFVDLNGNKTANTYFNIACLNLELVNMENTGSILQALDFSISKLKAERPDFNSGLAIESVKEAVCEKYNNFVDSDFSIDNPAIVKRKYYSGFQYTRNLKNNKVIVLHVMKGSDAENYLKEKDVILEVNDINLSSIKMEDLPEVFSSGDDLLKILIKRKREELEFLIKKEIRY